MAGLSVAIGCSGLISADEDIGDKGEGLEGGMLVITGKIVTDGTVVTTDAVVDMTVEVVDENRA